MATVKVGLRNLSIPQKISMANAIVSQMTGNPSFLTPNPALADVTTKTTVLDVAQTAAEAIRQASKAQTVLLNLTEDELDALINQLASYVENTAASDEQVVLSSGFDVVDTTGDVEPLYVPEDFFATTGDEEGEANLMWNRLKNVGKHTYNVFGRKYASGEEFALMAGTDQTKVDIKGLDVSTKYEFYVLGVKENQPGPPSETVIARAG
jgi:hypothetical protein